MHFVEKDAFLNFANDFAIIHCEECHVIDPEGNAEYEQRFGFIFLVFASGKSPAEILEILRRRLKNDRATEVRNAAGEQMKIARLRLQKMIRP